MMACGKEDLFFPLQEVGSKTRKIPAWKRYIENGFVLVLTFFIDGPPGCTTGWEILNGFCKEVLKELPLEFSVEAVKLLEMRLEGSMG